LANLGIFTSKSAIALTASPNELLGTTSGSRCSNRLVGSARTNAFP
jgi:hypothetical protein